MADIKYMLEQAGQHSDRAVETSSEAGVGHLAASVDLLIQVVQEQQKEIERLMRQLSPQAIRNVTGKRNF